MAGEGRAGDGVATEHDALIKKRRARSIDGLAARKARKNNRRATGLNAASAGPEGARPGTARRGAPAEQGSVRFGGGKPIEWVVERSGVRREAPLRVSTKSQLPLLHQG